MAAGKRAFSFAGLLAWNGLLTYPKETLTLNFLEHSLECCLFDMYWQHIKHIKRFLEMVVCYVNVCLLLLLLLHMPCCRWCWWVSGCLAAADGEADEPQEHSRLAVRVWSQVFGAIGIQSSAVPCADPEGRTVLRVSSCSIVLIA